MSGGHFDDKEINFKYVADELTDYLENNAQDMDPAVLDRLGYAVAMFNVAYVYAHRIDYLLSGDDSPETFIQRLTDDIEALKKEMNEKYSN